MSKLDELMARLCPDGVEYKTLGDIGVFYSGLTGKSKEDFKDGNATFITYMNVYSNIALKTDVEDKVRIGEKEKQNTVKYGDVLFTGSSETPDECGMSSVLTTKTDKKLYLNSFCFGYRFNEPDKFLPDFTKHLFRDTDLRKQISRTANGVTRFNVSKKKMEKVKIPVPPLEVQREIVRILDNFTELTARKQQYEYYRDRLLSFEGGQIDVQWSTLGDIGKISSGGTPNRGNAKYYNGNIPWLRTQEVDFCEINDTSIKITDEGLKNSSAKYIPANCVIIAMYGATVGKSAYNSIPLTTNQACCNLDIDKGTANYKYVYYWVANKYKYIKSLGQGSQTNVNAKIIKNIPIALPSLEEQNRIVSILDRFDTLCNDLTAGLPAEIKARQQQYEYYRDKLLTFKERE